tara:strand:+ start:106 stop:249 length:144 start_codon:yes stop_codon:yes gene_type:complete
MEERLHKLIEHFKYSENIYMVLQLEALKIEIDIAIADAKIQALKSLN